VSPAVQRRPERIIGNDTSLLGGVIAAATPVAVHAVLNRWLSVSDRAARVLEGKPTTTIKDGRFLPARRGGWDCGPPTWTRPSGCRTATTSRRWRLA
jgi:hypothetical protein